MTRREASINDLPIAEHDRRIVGPRTTPESHEQYRCASPDAGPSTVISGAYWPVAVAARHWDPEMRLVASSERFRPTASGARQ